MKISKATARYEKWLARHLRLIPDDVALKHQRMREAVFPFLRATYYRWAQTWPVVCRDLAGAPRVLSVGDLHVENFGTWRDAEGRLVWGINDFDEAWPLAYTNDLVRLATSAGLAISATDLCIDTKTAAGAILEGYQKALESGGRPYVLAEHQSALRDMAVERLKQPEVFWDKLDKLESLSEKDVPAGARKALYKAMPEAGLECRITHRLAGLGSLGRQRYVMLADWRGGKVAREAKALAPSACVWAAEGGGSGEILYREIVKQSVRCWDPFLRLKGRWIIRRLAPDCSRIELSALPKKRDEIRLLHAMGFETANIHLGSGKAHAILNDLKKRKPAWLEHAAKKMAEAVLEDWQDWKKD